MSFYDVRLDVTTDASGDGTATAASPVTGYICAIEFIDDALDDAHTAVLSFTSPAANSFNVWSTTANDTNSDVFKQPVIATVDQANDAVAATYGPNYMRPFVCGKLKLTIAAGGNAKTGGCIVYLEV